MKRRLVIKDMKNDMPPGARQEGIGLHELILLPLDIDFKNVKINWWHEEEEDSDLFCCL